jgi:hypothetical protein
MSEDQFHELMRRRNGAIEVVLRWHPESDSVSIHVVDDQTGDEHDVEVPRHEALDAFEHPFVYLPVAA